MIWIIKRTPLNFRTLFQENGTINMRHLEKKMEFLFEMGKIHFKW